MHIPPVSDVYPPSTFEPGREREEARIEGSFIFHNLLPELQAVVVAKTDYVTRILFTWTCKAFFNRYVQRDQFDSKKLLDKCAKAGNRKLVAACVEEYGAHVDIVTICKAARHGHSYDELWKPFLQNTRLVSDHRLCTLNNTPRSWKYVRAAEWAACGGHLNLSSALAICSWRATGDSPAADEQYAQGVNISPDRLIYQLAKGGHVDVAKRVYANLSDHQRTTLSESIKKSYIGLVFEGAVYSGNHALVNWCIAQNSHVLEEETYWDETDNNLVGWPLLDLLMWRAMTYGSLEWCMLAVEKGWQPKEDGGDGAALLGLKVECLFESKFIPTSNHFACLRYLHAANEDPDETVDHVNDNYFDNFPNWVDLEGLTWLHAQGYLLEIQKIFESYCHASRSKREVMGHSKSSIDQIVDWFIGKGATITRDAYLNAVSNDWIDLLNALWERKRDALPGEALKETIEAEAEFYKGKRENQDLYDLDYEECHKHRSKPLKRVYTLLRTVEWLLEKGNKLEGLQRQCDELALVMGRMNRRAAKIFCNHPAIKMHISKKCRERIFAREDIKSDPEDP